MEKILIIIFVLFIAWLYFGGLLENQSNYNTKNTVQVDCKLPGWKNDPVCTGEYEDQVKAEDAATDSYYQNTVR